MIDQDCSQCHSKVPHTKMRQREVLKAIDKGKSPHVFCDKLCSTTFYNKITNEKRKAVRLAKGMDGI